MKPRYTLLLLPAVFIPLALIAQGPLTPPAGAPAPVMKTLQQVEPRTDVATLAGDATAVFVITSPGSYYLSGNVSVPASRSGVAIAAANVVLDLNGFTITGATNSLRGVDLRSGSHAATVCNGVITGLTGDPGVGSSVSGLTNMRFERLAIRNCQGGIILASPEGASVDHVSVTGGNNSGIDLGSRSVVSHCAVDGVATSSTITFNGIRSGVATACSVEQLTNASGGVVGISAQEVNGCSVLNITGGGGTVGITAGVVTGCRVFNLSCNAAGSVTGISGAGRVNDCRVEDIGATGAGTPTGILAQTVSGCTVTSVGNTATVTSITGISCSGIASHCAVNTLGETGTAANVTGITAQQAVHCRASTLVSTGVITGITADAASDCTVESLTQGGAASTGIVTGISATRITACNVASLSGSSSAAVTGITGYRHASGCDAATISNGGSGVARGYQTASGGQTLQCNALNTGDFGVAVGTGSLVRGCTIRLSGTGIGIDIAGPAGVVEDNAVSACATGINAVGGSCFVVRNRLTTCTTNITTNATNQVGPAVAATGTITSTNPWANFTD